MGISPSTDWNDYDSHVARVLSGTGGITSRSGVAHAVIDSTVLPDTGAFSRLGGYSSVFGTGFRKRSAVSNVQVRINGIVSQVDYAGLQGGYVGLDQLNIVIPTGARGSGEVDLILTVDGKQANKVRVNIGN